jgi:hypothetical protein
MRLHNFREQDHVAIKTFESMCLITALKIHLSSYAHKALLKYPGYITDCRGETFVKVSKVYSVAVVLKSAFATIVLP